MNSMEWIFCALCLVAAAVVVYRQGRRTKRTMDTIEKMLDRAINGDFTEDTFDESRLSALETKFAHYLSASVISSQNVSVEKDKIKTLIADISHQTKTPIANLMLYSELLGEEELPPPAVDSVQAIYASAQKLRFLVDSLVKLSRLENGVVTLSPKRQPIGPMLQELLMDNRAKAAEKGLFLTLEGGDIHACFDGKWTGEALGNIVDNAIKYTEAGGVAISACEYEVFARIDIADSGIGLSEEERAKVFGRFYRSERVSQQDGVGVGLYLAREIISGQGGYIKVAQNGEKGTVFSVFLPK